MDSLKIIKQNCNKYLLARKKFLEFAESPQSKGLLVGNDNIIGSRIGEFIAWQLLKEEGRKPEINPQNNTKDYDITCGDGKKITVKLISVENKIGRTTRIGNEWDEFILILLNKKYKISSIGKITKKEFEVVIKNSKGRSKNPYVSRTMLNKNGLFRIAKAEIYEKNLSLYL